MAEQRRQIPPKAHALGAAPGQQQPRKGRPAAPAASPFPHRAAMREKGEVAQRLRGMRRGYLMMFLPNHCVAIVAAAPSCFMSASALSRRPCRAVSPLRTPTPYSSVPKCSSSTA